MSVWLRSQHCATMVEVVPGGCQHVRFVKNLDQHLTESELAYWLFENTELTQDGTMMFITILCWDGMGCVYFKFYRCTYTLLSFQHVCMCEILYVYLCTCGYNGIGLLMKFVHLVSSTCTCLIADVSGFIQVAA